ncbi:MAG: mechanosensitive ion channel [Clostridia bacterium]|nr:mechanosensitive ion channel [Clostridia bacterium]
MNELYLTAAEGTAESGAWLSALSKLNLHSILSALVILLVGYVLVKWVCKLLDKLLSRNGKLDASIRSILVNVIRILLLFLLLLTCADKLGLPTDSIITLLGTFGLAFSLAMQSSLSNLAGGLFILGSKPFETGDYVSVAGAEGTVTQIGFIHTALTTVDNKVIHVPNSTITGSVVTNFSSSQRRVDLTIPVSYNCSLEQAKKVIENVIARDSRVLQEPAAPFVRVWDLGASAVDIAVRVWCDGADYWELRSWLVENIKNELDKEGINIPYSQLDVHLIGKQ